MIITCLSDYDEELVRRLAGTGDAEIRIAPRTGGQADVAGLVADADIVIADAARHYVLDAAAIDAMRRCRFIQQPAVGYDTVDVARAAERGIPVANAPGYNAAAVADWTIMAMLVVLRGGLAADASLRGAGWAARPLGEELGARTVGLVGMGAVARAAAARLRGFGAAVVFTARTPREVEGARQVDFGDLLATADVISLHLPITAQTRGLIGRAELAAMREGAILVNSARGGLVDHDALAEGLRAGRPAAAALDVFDPEPLPDDSPLRGLGNVYLSPHIAAGTWQARSRVRAMVGENLRRVIAGERPLHVVNAHDQAVQSSAAAAVQD
ncbi:hydroxyacid dehydrogenase [Spongiactinospora gelatinilytica]|uniref:Hydroxyacid dehydrogenase n=1 Tax=Spongiactinospora gelatinilytica TaxID=2666298 RepID=A0A2W2IE86_9ACTN|nr:NAD(P)-dependent oxidoreductase [Spongiactinospora gelatinilytica]PZG56407.1 hydroxyacid dehydrogenase [Spongiactinospora gelatinilytica]